MKTPNFIKQYKIELDVALDIKETDMGNWMVISKSFRFNNLDSVGVMIYVELITEKRTQILERLFSRYMSLLKAKYKRQLGL